MFAYPLVIPERWFMESAGDGEVAYGPGEDAVGASLDAGETAFDAGFDAVVGNSVGPGDQEELG